MDYSAIFKTIKLTSPNRKRGNIQAWSAFKNKKELYMWTAPKSTIPEDWKK